MHPVLFTISTATAAAFFCAAFSAAAAGGLWAWRRPASKFAIAAALVGAATGGASGWALASRFGARSIPVYAYGTMLGASFIAGWLVVMVLGARHARLPREKVGHAFVLTAVFAVVGARALFVLTNPSLFNGPAQWLAVGEGGMVAYGGFVGGLVGGWLYFRKTALGVLGWGDLAAPALGLGLGLTRIGCYLYGCDFGLPLGSGAPAWLREIGSFPRGSPAFATQVARYGLSPEAPASLPVHPTQLYESAVGFLLFAVTLSIWSRRRFPGQVLLVFTTAYGVWRFLIEFVRDDPQRGSYLGLSTSQLISMALVPLAVWGLHRLGARAATVSAPS